MKIKILYEDKDCVAILKPAGLVVHSDGKTKEPVLTDWILETYPKTKKVGEPIVQTDGGIIYRPGIVHRLDRDTSGVMIIAKTQEAHAHLKEQFQNRTVKKKYYAFVYGLVKDKYGIINRPIGRSKNDFRKWTAQRGTRGELREAETWYTTIKAEKRASFIEAEPKTGRTHQIRVHFTAMNHPVVADSLYAPGNTPILGFKRNALHAHTLELRKMDGTKLVIKAPLPLDFKKACKEMDIDVKKLEKVA